MTHNEEKTLLMETNWEITQMIEFIDKGTKTVITALGL